VSIGQADIAPSFAQDFRVAFAGLRELYKDDERASRRCTSITWRAAPRCDREHPSSISKENQGVTPLPPPAIVSIAHRRRGQKVLSAREPFFGSLAAIVRRIGAALSFSG
jgi:hypothetical protein